MRALQAMALMGASFCRQQRQGGERFIDTIKRVGLDPFKASTNAVRRSTARHAAPDAATAE